MPAATQPDVVIGQFRLDRLNRRLTHAGASVSLGGRALDVLEVLAAGAGETVGKHTLLDQVWPGLTVEENTLQVHISALRKVLGQGAIITVPGRGYRLVMAAPDETPDSSAGQPSIAVLPFANLSGDIEQEYFADGIAEDIITELSRLPWLSVIARSSSFAYKGRALDIRQLGRDLAVRYVLEGSVRRSSDRLRVTAQLIDAGNGAHIWAERYDRTVTDLFAVQDEITEAAVIAVGGRVTDIERQRALRRPPASLSAWAAYQRGLWHFSRLLPDGAELAIGMFRRSAELDPQFAPALTAWALVLLFQATGLSRAPFATTMAEAEIVARRAVDIAPNEADARGVLAQALLFRGDFTGAETHIGKAQEIDRGAPMTLRAAGALLVFTGRFEQGREALRAYLRRNPHDVWRAGALAQIVFSYYCEGYYHEALAEAREAIQQVPTHGLSYRWAAAALGQLGQQAEAVAMLRQAREVSPTAFAFFTDGRPPPFIRPEYHAHMLEGLRKAGWHE